MFRAERSRTAVGTPRNPGKETYVKFIVTPVREKAFYLNQITRLYFVLLEGTSCFLWKNIRAIDVMGLLIQYWSSRFRQRKERINGRCHQHHYDYPGCFY